MADDVTQPVEQTEQGGNTGLYDLESVDPGIREQLEPHLKQIEANATKKFQEAAEYRKTWTPYEELGIQNVSPEELQQLFAFTQMLQEPEQLQAWWKEVGDQNSFFDAFGPEEEIDLGFGSELTQEQINAQITEAVQQALNPIQQQLEAQESAKVVAEAEAELNSQLEAIRAENPDLPEGAEDAIARLAYSYVDDPATADRAIQKGFEDYMSLIGVGEKNLFTQKGNQPAGAERGGTPATAPEPITSFSDPRLKAQALERMRQSNS